MIEASTFICDVVAHNVPMILLRTTRKAEQIIKIHLFEGTRVPLRQPEFEEQRSRQKRAL